MKRFLALFTAILLVCLSLPVFAAAEEEKPLWLVKYNDATIEGAGVVFTEKYEGAAWWFHAAFVPTDVEGVWKITEICDGIEDSVVGGAGGGKAQPLAIPEGGFVYAINVGNDYPTLYPNEANTVDYTSEACTACIQDIQANWKVGIVPFILGCLSAVLFGQAWYSKNGLYIMLVLIAITVAWAYFLYKKGKIQ